MLEARVRFAIPSAVALVLSFAVPGSAEAGQRAFVSTGGLDNPACSIGSPCRSFDAAIAAANPGGEVVVLDSGGYGPFTITKSVSVVAPPGVYAGISVTTGNGITISTASASDTVRLTGLAINDVGTGYAGISDVGASGSVVVRDVVITGFQYGIDFEPVTTNNLDVAGTAVAGATSAGIQVSGGPSFARAVFDGVVVHHCTGGFFIVNNSNVVVRNSRVTDNGNGIGVYPQLAGSSTEFLLEASTVAYNSGHGVSVGDPNGTSTATIVGSTLANNLDGVYTTNAANVRLAGTTITRNTTGIDDSQGGFAQSQGNNFIYGNAADGAAPTVVGSK